jgi:hypothetical protein
MRDDAKPRTLERALERTHALPIRLEELRLRLGERTLCAEPIRADEQGRKARRSASA